MPPRPPILSDLLKDLDLQMPFAGREQVLEADFPSYVGFSLPLAIHLSHQKTEPPL